MRFTDTCFLPSLQIEYGREALSILRVAPVPESEFLNYCGLRQKHSAVIDKLEFAKTLKFDDDRWTSFETSFSFVTVAAAK
jgi:hypothetical protein